MLRRMRRLFARQEAFERLSGRAFVVSQAVMGILMGYVIMTLAIQLNPTLVGITILIALGVLLADLLNAVRSEEPA